MNVRSAAAILMVLLGTSSFALAADPRDTPANRLMFPESVERAMMGERAARRLDRLKNSTAIEWEFEHQSGPLSQVLSAPNLPKSNSKPAPSAQQDAPAASDASPKQDDYPELKQAMQPLAEGKVDEALKVLHEAARKHPLLPSEYVVLYHVFVRTNQRDQARSWLEKAIVETPRDPEPWIIVGEFALNEKRFSEAELDFEKAKQLLTGYSNADRKQLIERELLNDLARVSEGREQWPEAKSRLDEYLKKSPEDLDALQRLARATFCDVKADKETRSAYSAAYKLLERAKEIDKSNAEKNHTSETLLPAPALLAQLYDKYELPGWSTRRSRNAVNLFRYALKQSSDDLALRAVVSDWALRHDEIDLAQEQADAALSIEAKDALQKYRGSFVGHLLGGRVALRKKQWPSAENHFQAVYNADPDYLEASDKLALALVEQNVPAKKEKALNLAYANYQNNKDNNHSVDAAATLSWVYFRMGKFDLASAAMDAVLRGTNGNVANPDTATYLAYILDQNDNGHNGLKYKAKRIVEQLRESGKPFRMKPEAEALYTKLKDVKAP